MQKFLIFFGVFFMGVLCGESGDELVKKALDSGLKPILTNKELQDTKLAKINKAQIELGKKLFFDPRLSQSNIVSCNTCHNLALGATDARKLNPWFMKNSPTIYNSFFNAQNFWDKQIQHLKEQSKITLSNNKIESKITTTKEDSKNIIINKIQSMPDYIIDFKKAYGNNAKISIELIVNAIDSFQKTLITPARYDDFLRGNIKALSKDEQEGLDLFINKGCVSCHDDVNLGGKMRDSNKQFTFVSSNANIASNLKIPTLRNILETMPYLSSGEYENIKDVIQMMAQIGDEINDEEAQKIETFFNSLSGKKPDISYPTLPTLPF